MTLIRLQPHIVSMILSLSPIYYIYYWFTYRNFVLFNWSVTDRVKDFFGVGEIDEATKERYRKRREKCYRTDLKDQAEELDSGRRIGRRKCKGKKKESFVTIVGKAVAVSSNIIFYRINYTRFSKCMQMFCFNMLIFQIFRKHRSE